MDATLGSTLTPGMNERERERNKGARRSVKEREGGGLCAESESVPHFLLYRLNGERREEIRATLCVCVCVFKGQHSVKLDFITGANQVHIL